MAPKCSSMAVRHYLLLGGAGALVLLSSLASAQVSDPAAVIRSSGLSAPAAGASVTDPAFGVTVRRLTSRGENGGLATAEYPQLQAINADETRVLISTDTDFRVIDLATGTETHVGINLSMPRWHPMEADTLIGFNQRSGNNIQFQHVDLMGNGVFMTRNIVNISNLGYQGLTLGSWEDSSADGRYIAILNQSGGSDQAALIDTVTGQVRAQIDTGGLDWVSASPSGQYLVLQYANRGEGPTSGLVVLDGTSGQLLGHATDHHEHGDLGVDAQGNDVFATIGWTDYCAMGEAPCFSVSPFPDTIERNNLQNRREFSPGIEAYTSCRNLRRGGFCVTSDDYGNPGSGAFGGEIWLNRMSDGAVLRLAHHRTSARSYYTTARPVLSPTGRYIVFTSDWARPNGADQGDLYVIDVSAYLDTFLAGPPPPMDAGVVDTGPNPDPDAGTVQPDAAPAPDAGPDSGPAPDGGVLPRDSGVHPDAAGPAADAGSTVGPRTRGTSGGCTCLKPQTFAPWSILALLGIFLIRRRR